MSWWEYYRLPHTKTAATLLGDMALLSPRFHHTVGSWLYENGGIVATRLLWFKVVRLPSTDMTVALRPLDLLSTCIMSAKGSPSNKV